MIEAPGIFGLEDGSLPARISFLTVAVWWAGFAQIPFNRLPENPYKRKAQKGWVKKGYQELVLIYGQVKRLPQLKRYLIAYFFFNGGVQAVMYLASLFGAKELKMETQYLILTVLIIQLVAIGGAYLFADLSEKRGNIYSLMTMIVIWIVVCLAAFFVQNDVQFFILAFFVGIIMGGIQALSKSYLLEINSRRHRRLCLVF